MASTQSLFARRRQRNRIALKKNNNGRPRLSIHRTNQHIYAQIIDDVQGKTLASASTIEPALRDEKLGKNTEAAARVGKLIAERALAADVKTVVFDRGGFIYHGRVKALADAARDGGLDF